ncbi:MAG TPA: DegT/DnrJ/EryC1/StrS family aminotransferase [Micromonosporaceae bacterium]|jgi:dTDP-4-amino-4,6-dideoxygalactose transaminase|nr:DegT/DnrJ/EryC1/StrS family aminotransferase [Micromonosporaceae bacterium]
MTATTAATRLALFGGEAAVPIALRSAEWPVITPKDIFAVMRVLHSGAIMSIERNARDIANLEAEYARYIGVRHCLALASGTAALHACMAAVGVEPGDEVIVPALSFLASATSVIHQQGIPVFVDIEPDTYNIDPRRVEEKVTGRTRAIEVVHLHGLPADMDGIGEIARRRSIAVIEDYAQAHGARYRGKLAGAIGDANGSSVMADKNLATCGEGGLFTTNSDALRERAERLLMFSERELAMLWQDDAADDGEDVDTLGFNYRFNPMQAAFARSQLRRLDEFNALRNRNAAILDATLAGLPGLMPPVVPAGSTHVYYLYRFRIDPAAMGVDIAAGPLRRAFQDALLAEGVGAREWQNTPLPGLELFQRREGYGGGCPWTCQTPSRVEYRIEDYPSTLDVLESTLVLGREVLVPADADQVHCHASAFEKVYANRAALFDYARQLDDYQPPWEGVRRLA